MQESFTFPLGSILAFTLLLVVGVYAFMGDYDLGQDSLTASIV
jgi:hypothetical protein